MRRGSVGAWSEGVWFASAARGPSDEVEEGLIFAEHSDEQEILRHVAEGPTLSGAQTCESG